jgi:transformation/transcription domain-associated protein
MLKQTELFCSLMQALSCHLRPAPYPYGLLTLRLLGKLGGKNRQFLREPMRLPPTEEKTGEPSLSIKCSWRSDESDDTDSSALTLPLPIDRALEVLKMVAQDEQLAEKTSERSDTSASCSSTGTIVHWENNSNLWDCRIEDLNVEAYSKEVIEETQHRQATASLAVMRSAVKMTLCDNVHKNSLPGNEQKQVCMALMYASMINSIRAEAWDLLKDMSDRFEQKNIFDSLCLFISDPSESTTCVGLEYLNFLLESKKRGTTSMSFDVFVRVLCEACCSNCWGRSSGLQEAICVLIEVLGREWSRKHEVRLINAALLPIKTVPRELSCAAVTAVRFFIRVCTGLYGNEFCGATVSNEVVWDVLCFDGLPEERNSADGPPDERINLGDSSKGSDEGTVLQPEANARPCEEVFKITLYEIASPQQLVRYVC